MPKRSQKRNSSRDTPAYKELIGDLKKIISDAAAKGVDFSQRDDMLTCQACGAYEDALANGRWIIYNRQREVVNDKEFILIDRKERSTWRGRTSYYKITYDFLCSVCGARQQEIVRDRFEH